MEHCKNKGGNYEIKNPREQVSHDQLKEKVIYVPKRVEEAQGNTYAVVDNNINVEAIHNVSKEN